MVRWRQPGEPAMRPIGLSAALFLVACASGTGAERPASPTPLTPSNSAVAGLGYDDAVRLGADFAQSRGQQLALIGAEQRGGIWYVRYRKAAPTTGNVDLRFDAQTGELVGMDELPDPATPPPKEPGLQGK